jgi:hypothetical protein
MRHVPLKPGLRSAEHWAVSVSSALPQAYRAAQVLVQLGDETGEQVRVAMRPHQAREMARALLLSATAVEESNRSAQPPEEPAP